MAAAEELLDRIMQMADNAGATDEHRALNYVAMRYDAIYGKTAEMHGRNFSLTAVEVRPSPLSGVRKIVDAIFSYTQRETDFTEKFFVRVDVTEEFRSWLPSCRLTMTVETNIKEMNEMKLPGFTAWLSLNESRGYNVMMQKDTITRGGAVIIPSRLVDFALW